MGWTDRFRRKPAMESRAEWGSSAIPLPNEGNANTYANVDLRRADSSLQKVAVWAAVTLLARLVSSLPLDTYRRRGDGPPANIGNSRFLEDPAGDGQGLPDWLSQYMMSVLLRGNVYGKQILGPDAYPTQIVLYHPDTVDGWRDLYTGQVHWYVEGRDLGASGVWHRRAYPMPGNLLGMSPIGLHMTTIGQGMAAARFGYQFFADGAMPTGMLRNTEVAIDKRVADVAKARWMAAMHGSREVAVMGKGWEYQAIQVAPEESQFLETQKYTAAECARIYGPGVPEILGYETGGSMTYANVDQRSLHLLIYSLDPWLTGLERMFTAMLPQPQFVKFNRAALLRMTTDQRYAAYQTASLIGLQTPNEQRAMEDWGPVPWGDKPWVAAQQAPPPGPPSARSQISVRTEDPWDEESAALLVALAQLDDEEGFAQRAWDAGKHPRIPKGEPGGGRFLSLVEQFKGAIKKHAEGGGGHPLDGFNREQLRRVAKARGINLERGEDRDSIAAKLLGHLGGDTDVKLAKAPARVSGSADEVKKAKEHADAIGSSRKIAWAQRDRVKRELARQAELTPRNMLKLNSVHIPKTDSKHGADFLNSDVVGSAFAYYSPLGSSPAVYATRNAKQGDGPAIWLNPYWATDNGIGKLSVAHIKAGHEGHLSPTGAESAMESTLAHEYGHHVARVFEGDIGFGVADMPGELAERFLPAVNEALGANRMSQYPLRGNDHDLLKPVHWGSADDPRYSVAGQLLDGWVDRNKDLIRTKVSKYGAVSFAEMLAEIWQEYSTKGPDARPHIKVIGDLMREIAEEADS